MTWKDMWTSVCFAIGLTMLGHAVYGQATVAEIVDLSHVPQLNESEEEREQRLEWFRDAKFGMFIHWGPSSVGKREIGWGRKANRPWDIDRHGPRESDPVYDNYYKQFNPTNFNADAWVSFAKECGMRYMVLIAKHHDGFSMFDSKVTDYDITATPYEEDIVRQFVDACHRQDMPVGLYYSTRDWYHEDYLVGDNNAYDLWYRTQVEELLTKYGDIDILWFDHVGGRDWSKWRFDKLFAMMYEKQPDLIVNNRAARFCGARAASKPNVPPVNKDIEKMTQGDYVTPEGKIGKMDLNQDWESCIHVGKGWSYRGEDGFKGPEDCIRMLVSCTTGGGNLLLNFGPRPDGTFADGEADVGRALGKWLDRYGEAIYGTRGGPYKNGKWGGSSHKGKTLYLHVYEFPAKGLVFDPLPYKILSAENLSGETVEFEQTTENLAIRIPDEDRDTPVTVIKLNLDQTIPEGKIVGDVR